MKTFYWGYPVELVEEYLQGRVAGTVCVYGRQVGLTNNKFSNFHFNDCCVEIICVEIIVMIWVHILSWLLFLVELVTYFLKNKFCTISCNYLTYLIFSYITLLEQKEINKQSILFCTFKVKASFKMFYKILELERLLYLYEKQLC